MASPLPSPSPAQSNTSTDTGASQPAALSISISGSASAPPPTTAAVSRLPRLDAPSAPPKTLRGHNKPKCFQCGNVARSRCPFQCCKGCCVKAQNPCDIHVNKKPPTVSDKAQAAGSPKVNEQSNAAFASGPSHRVPSYRQLSNQFSQFSNLTVPQSRKPMTRKEAFSINEWRFSKLKEYHDRNIEVENEAFDRYMQNIRLLEEVLSAESEPENSAEVELTESSVNSSVTEENTEIVVSRLKLKLKSNPVKAFNSKERLRDIIDCGLKKFHKRELKDGEYELQDFVNQKKRAKSLRDERASALNDLMDKINKARNAEDVHSCIELKSQLFKKQLKKHQFGVIQVESSNEHTNSEANPKQQASSSLQKLVRTVNIDQETLNSIDIHFSSLEGIEDL